MAIIGAGPAGLALTAAMRAKGLSVGVFEAVSEVKERGAAVFLHVSVVPGPPPTQDDLFTKR